MDKKYKDKLKKLNPEKLAKLLREKQKRYRDRKKQEKKARRNKKIDQEMNSGNLNYGLDKGKEKFMTYEEWKNSFPDSNTSEFLRAKIGHDSKKTHKPRDRNLTGLIGNVPILRRTSLTCLKVRKMHLGVIPFDPICIQNHTTCPACNLWFAKNKRKFPVKWRGFDLFHSEEKSKPTNEENQNTLREVMEEHFKDDYNENRYE